MANILQGNSLTVLKSVPDNSIDCCVTSPPYYALRDYGTGHWEGGDPNCDHVANANATKVFGNAEFNENRPSRAETKCAGYYKTICPKCGAVRVDEQIGLEETPEEYIQKLVELFHEVRRVLKPEGTLWLNIGDSYATNSPNNRTFIDEDGRGGNNANIGKLNVIQNGVKPKDLIGIPWMLAFALRSDGWYLRQDIIWAKTNCMPESVTDRCTKSHEYIFLLSKSPKYYFDNNSIKTPCKPETANRYNYEFYTGKAQDERHNIGGTNTQGMKEYTGMANKRDVWNVSCSSYKEAHFATFPEELVRPCIRAGCPLGGTVLDPFFGSGTTGAVAVQEGRDYLGIELNPEYIKLADKRLSEQQIRLPI